MCPFLLLLLIRLHNVNLLLIIIGFSLVVLYLVFEHVMGDLSLVIHECVQFSVASQGWRRFGLLKQKGELRVYLRGWESIRWAQIVVDFLWTIVIPVRVEMTNGINQLHVLLPKCWVSSRRKSFSITYGLVSWNRILLFESQGRVFWTYLSTSLSLTVWHWCPGTSVTFLLGSYNCLMICIEVACVVHWTHCCWAHWFGVTQVVELLI